MPSSGSSSTWAIPAAAAPGAGPNHVTTVSVTPDGSTAYLDSCCEPAAGLILAVPTDGSREPEALNPGLGPAVSPDGRLLAYTAINAVVVRDLTTGQEQVFTDPAYDESPLFGEVTWSRDGTKLCYAWERQGAGSTDAAASLVELTVTPGRRHGSWPRSRVRRCRTRWPGTTAHRVGPAPPPPARRFRGTSGR